jgi:hypothetical protein
LIIISVFHSSSIATFHCSIIPNIPVFAFPSPTRSRGEDLEFARFLGIWIDLQRKNGTIQALYDHWILGRDAAQATPLVGDARRAALGEIKTGIVEYWSDGVIG